MDFGLSEEQEMLQETVRGFVANECPPSKLREIFDADVGHDAGLWRGAAEIGLAGLMIPESHGGAGMDLLDMALVMEVIGAGALPSPLASHSIAAMALCLGGSKEQKQRWLPGMASGETIATVALADAPQSWLPDSWSAKLTGARVSGSKRYVPHADLAQLFIVGVEGGGLVVLEAGADGLAIESMGGIDQTRPISRIDLTDTACETLPEGRAAAVRVYDAGLVLLAADSFGAANELIRMSSEYAKTRQQFGFPIAQFQSVKHQLARLATDIEPTRSLFWYAAYAVDHLPEEASHAASLAKAHITDRAMNTARQAVELHGGVGFTWECDVQMWFKRAMFNRAFLGTPEFQRERCAQLSGW